MTGEDHTPDQHGYTLPYHWCMSDFYRYIVGVGVERVAKALSGRSVLEIGCGDGFVTSLLARHARCVVGVDLNERAIAFARLIVEEPHVSFRTGRAGDVAEIAAEMPEQPEVVAAFEVLEHLATEEMEAFLNGAREVLSPGRGALVITTPNGGRHRHPNPHHAVEFTPSALRGALERAGFVDVRIEGLYLKPPDAVEHFATSVVLGPVLRALVRAGASRPERCRTLVCSARPR